MLNNNYNLPFNFAVLSQNCWIYIGSAIFGNARGKLTTHPHIWKDTKLNCVGKQKIKVIQAVWKWNIIARKYCSITSAFWLLFYSITVFYFMQIKFAGAIKNSPPPIFDGWWWNFPNRIHIKAKSMRVWYAKELWRRSRGNSISSRDKYLNIFLVVRHIL